MGDGKQINWRIRRQRTTATGFAFGLDRLILALEKLNRIHADPYRADVFIATKPETLAFGIQIAKRASRCGITSRIGSYRPQFLRP